MAMEQHRTYRLIGEAGEAVIGRFGQAVILAVILFVGVAGGVLVSFSYEAQLEVHEWRNEGYAASAPVFEATVVSQPSPACEEYSKLITIGGQSQTIYGTACRQPDGTWDSAR